jgi:ubiquinone/menaquinone biosynthesis C-methylase UbiE
MMASGIREMPEQVENEVGGAADVSKAVHQFVQVAPLYDLLMTGVPYHDWVAYLKQLLTTRSARPKRVLDLACGTGNVSELLVREGYTVTGVDIAPDMIAEARRKADRDSLSVGYFVQDAAELDLPDARFDLCISLFDSLNYIIEPVRLAMAIRRVAQHLEPGGLFIFDINSEFALKNRFFDQDNLAHPEERLMYDWDSSYSEQARLCRVDMKFWYREDTGERRQFDECHVQYAYRADEVQKMLADAGFEDISIYQAYTLRAPTKTSDRLFFVSRKS